MPAEPQFTVDLKEWMSDKFAAQRDHFDLRMATIEARLARSEADGKAAVAETRIACEKLDIRVDAIQKELDELRGSRRVLVAIGAGSGAVGLFAAKLFEALGG